MSVICETPEKEVLVLSKGADNVIYANLDKKTYKSLMNLTLDHLELFGSNGYRTLCIASKSLSKVNYEKWNEKYKKVQMSSDKDRLTKLEGLEYDIEQGLLLLGATAIEDALQDAVPETISSLIKANIRVWMITGDKRETAINIGISCHLITHDMEVVLLQSANLDDMITELKFIKMQMTGNEALVLSGDNLSICLPDKGCSDMLFEILVTVKAVLCCRVSPKQKANIVEEIRKRHPSATTLAVGDGANDVEMIQAAHVGIGIRGKEGLQAALSSDYAIAQFRFLEKLLLVHGQWNYVRITKMINYSFYKNLLFFSIIFWYCLCTGFSGTIVYDDAVVVSYNMFFTSATPFVIGTFEKWKPKLELLMNPIFYQRIQSKHFFNCTTFLRWIMSGFFHSAVIFWCTYFMMKHGKTVTLNILLLVLLPNILYEASEHYRQSRTPVFKRNNKETDIVYANGKTGSVNLLGYILFIMFLTMLVDQGLLSSALQDLRKALAGGDMTGAKAAQEIIDSANKKLPDTLLKKMP